MCKSLISTTVAVTILTSIVPAFAQDSFRLEGDLRDYCTDQLGQQVRSDINQVAQNNSGSRDRYDSHSHQESSESYLHRQAKVGGGWGFIRASGSGESTRSNSDQLATASVHQSGETWNQDRQTYNEHHSVQTTAVGKNCDELVRGAAQVEMMRIQAETQMFHELMDW